MQDRRMKAMKRITAVQGRRGSTLIEILVTIFVLTGGLFVLYGMYPQGFNILENAKNINTAKGLIQTNITDIQSRSGNLPFAIVPCDDNGDPDGSWGWALEQGATMIQTDRPAELIKYLESKGRRNL